MAFRPEHATEECVEWNRLSLAPKTWRAYMTKGRRLWRGLKLTGEGRGSLGGRERAPEKKARVFTRWRPNWQWTEKGMESSALSACNNLFQMLLHFISFVKFKDKYPKPLGLDLNIQTSTLLHVIFSTGILETTPFPCMLSKCSSMLFSIPKDGKGGGCISDPLCCSKRCIPEANYSRKKRGSNVAAKGSLISWRRDRQNVLKIY